MTTEHLPDDFAAAIKAADDYADMLNHLALHGLTERTDRWITEELQHIADSMLTLRLDADLHGKLS